MRVLHFMADGSAGGGATVVLGLVKGMLDRGLPVGLLTDEGSYCAEQGRALGAEVAVGSFMHSRTDPAILARVEDAAKGYDVIHLHGGRAAFFGRNLKGIAKIYTVHGYHFLRKDPLRRFMGMLGERKAVPTVQSIVFVCDYDRQAGVQHSLIPPRAKSRVIYNGVSFGEMPATHPVPKQIAYIHRLVEQKHPEMAVETMRLLAQDGFRMIMAGGGYLEPEVRGLVAKYGLEKAIEVRGEVSRPQALEILAQSETMLMTSRWEGLPLAPLEAMAMGVPVVAPAVSGIPEIIDSGIDGHLVTIHSAESYAQAIRGAAQNRDSIIAVGQRKVAERFSWDHCLESYLEAYRELATP
jgi:glycosyltransferase involved in cell wall biosynthesis